jgi:predicted RNA polymerase sigma factor
MKKLEWHGIDMLTNRQNHDFVISMPAVARRAFRADRRIRQKIVPFEAS